MQRHAAMFRIKRDFPWFNIMAWLSREILVYDHQDNLVAGVTRVWHPFKRMCVRTLCSNSRRVGIAARLCEQLTLHVAPRSAFS